MQKRPKKKQIKTPRPCGLRSHRKPAFVSLFSQAVQYMNYQQSEERTLAITRAGPGGPRHQGQRHSAGLKILYHASPVRRQPSCHRRLPASPQSQRPPRSSAQRMFGGSVTTADVWACKCSGGGKGRLALDWPLPSSSRLKSWRYEYYASHAQQFISNIKSNHRTQTKEENLLQS